MNKKNCSCMQPNVFLLLGENLLLLCRIQMDNLLNIGLYLSRLIAFINLTLFYFLNYIDD